MFECVRRINTLFGTRYTSIHRICTDLIHQFDLVARNPFRCLSQCSFFFYHSFFFFFFLFHMETIRYLFEHKWLNLSFNRNNKMMNFYHFIGFLIMLHTHTARRPHSSEPNKNGNPSSSFVHCNRTSWRCVWNCETHSTGPSDGNVHD